MAKLAKLAEFELPLLVEKVLTANTEAESARERETRAACRIQGLFRGVKVRRNLRRIRKAAGALQKEWRGWLGRRRFETHRADADAKLREVYFKGAATEIQRVYRGHLSRLHKHSFYARKAYLEAVAERSSALREANDAALQEQLINQEQAAREAAEAAFKKTISGMHHLVSTQSSAGIYNSPFSAVVGGKPSVAGRPLEDHLRETRHSVGASQLLPRTSARPIGSLGATTTKMTIRASDPYVDAHERRRRAETSSTALRMSKSPFHTAVKQRPVDRAGTLQASEPFAGALTAADRRRG